MVGTGKILGDIVGPTGRRLGSLLVKLLLDTHIWLWGLLEPERVSRRVEKALADPANELWLSPISVGELIVLLRFTQSRS